MEFNGIILAVPYDVQPVILAKWLSHGRDSLSYKTVWIFIMLCYVDLWHYIWQKDDRRMTMMGPQLLLLNIPPFTQAYDFRLSLKSIHAVNIIPKMPINWYFTNVPVGIQASLTSNDYPDKFYSFEQFLVLAFTSKIQAFFTFQFAKSEDIKNTFQTMQKCTNAKVS